jgi:phosphatidylserine/phosphatidylglycerophosphate/cardiolipin synthase-like enzyme
VRVHVLVEGAPVAGVSEAESAILDELANAGADVRRIGGSGRDRYGVVHSKFLVVDGEWLVLGSENWTPSGFPEQNPPTSAGNLGWTAVVRSEELATFYGRVWEEDADLQRGDVRRQRVAAGPPQTVVPEARSPDSAPPTLVPTTASALLVPDNAGDALLALLDGANLTIDVEALQLPWTWDSEPNPVIAALQRAAMRGVRVRILLDAVPGGANDATIRGLGAWASDRGVALEIEGSQDARVHNKAVVADGRSVWVGSMNFGEASMTRNREAALLLEGPVAADAAGTFEEDWNRVRSTEPARADPAWLALPLAGLVLLGVVRSRGSERLRTRR